MTAAAIVLSLLVSVLMLSVPSVAVHNDNFFELGPGVPSDESGRTNILGDGNAANGPDWADIFDGSGNVILPGAIASFIKDDLSQAGAVDRTTFSGAGGSNKNNDPISGPGDTWHWDTGNVPAKDDLSNAYAYATFTPNDHLIIYVGFERIDSSGDSHIDLEFFRSAVSLDEAIPCDDPGADVTPCSFLGSRSVGDIIVSMDFLNGGGFGTMAVREWDGTIYQLVETITGQGCNAADTICGFNNGGSISGGPWPNYDRHGSEITNLPANGLTEFGIDLTALEGSTPCISSVMGKTRSSQSFTAELKDFAGPVGFPICEANIAITPDAVNEVGQEHTFTVEVNQVVAGVEGPADDGTIVTVTLTAANGAAVNLIDDNCASPGTVAGTCTVTFSSDSAGTITGHASANVEVLGDTIFVETDGVGDNSGDAVKTYVDAKIAIAADAANEVGDPHTFTVTVMADFGDGLGFVPATEGDVDFTLTDSNGAVSVLNAGASTCDDAGDNLNAFGQCTIVFTSNSAGKVTGHASVTLDVLGVSLSRETDGVSPNSDDAVKTYVDASITIAPSETNEVGQDHTFTVEVLIDYGDGAGPIAAPDGTIVSVVLTDAGGALSIVTSDTCGTGGTSGGMCSVTFSSNSAGTVTAHATVTLDVLGVSLFRQTDGVSPNSDDVVKTYVDAFITIAPSAANEVGTPHFFTVHVEADDGSGIDSDSDGSTFDPVEGAMPEISFPDGAPATVDTVDCDDGTDANGDCTVMISSDVAGIFTAHASVDVLVGGLTLFRETDGSAPNSGDAVKTYVDAFIMVGPDQVNEINDLHIFTVHVEFNDGTGFAPAAGAIVTVSWVGGAPDFVDDSDCADGTDANGDCDVAISSTVPGTFTVHASVDLTVLGVPLHRETDGEGLNSDDATKTYVDAFITIAPSETNEVGQPHTFTVSVEVNYGDGAGYIPATDGDVDFTLADSNGAVSVLDAGASTCDDAGDNLDAFGQCTIVFTSYSAGKVTGHASVTLDALGVTLTRETDGDGLNSGDAVKTYVDAFITISPLKATNEVNDPHTLTVHVEADDGSGIDSDSDGSTFDPVAGATPSITFPDGAPSSVDTSDCSDGTDASGNCFVIINSPDAGSFTIHASVDVEVGGVSLHRETDGTGMNSDDAEKVYVDAFIGLSPLEDTNEVNDDHVITATVWQDDGLPAPNPNGDGVDGFGPAPDGTLVQFSFAFNSAGAVFVGDDFCTTVGGSCSVTITAGDAGTVLVHATTTFFVGGVELTRSTGTGGLNSEDAQKVYVDAFITISPDDTNGIGEDHTFVVTVMVDYGDGSGPQAAPDNTLVDVTLTNGGGAAYVVSSDTCAGGGTSGGICTVTFTSDTAGTVTGHAEVTLDVSGVSLTRDTDGIAPNSGDAVKTFVDGSIVWHKVDQSGQPLGGATFEVCRTHTLDTSTDPDTMVDTPDACVTVLDNSAPDEDPAAGEFLLTGLVLGRYTVRETIAPPDYTIGDPNPVTAPDMSLADPDVEIVTPFVNNREFEGCSPGFWKTHPELWDGGSDDVTDTIKTYLLFNSVFGVTSAQSGLDNTVTLLQATGLKGGDLIALDRHAAAALPSADSGINYPYSVAQVIAMYRDAVGADAGPETIQSALAKLSAANNLNCPLSSTSQTASLIGVATIPAAAGAFAVEALVAIDLVLVFAVLVVGLVLGRSVAREASPKRREARRRTR